MLPRFGARVKRVLFLSFFGYFQCRVKLISFLILKKMVNLNQKNLKFTSSLIL